MILLKIVGVYIILFALWVGAAYAYDFIRRVEIVPKGDL